MWNLKCFYLNSFFAMLPLINYFLRFQCFLTNPLKLIPAKIFKRLEPHVIPVFKCLRGFFLPFDWLKIMSSRILLVFKCLRAVFRKHRKSTDKKSQKLASQPRTKSLFLEIMACFIEKNAKINSHFSAKFHEKDQSRIQLKIDV